jgi:hypothetical protein
MIVAAAMFVIADNQQGFAPNLAGPQTVVDVGDQLFAESDHRWRVLIVFWMAEIGKVLRLDERIGRQPSSLAVSLKLAIGLEVVA